MVPIFCWLKIVKMKSLIHNTQTQKIKESFIHFSYLYFMGSHSSPCRCKLFTDFIFFLQLLHLAVNSFKLNKNMNKVQKLNKNMKKISKWSSVSPCPIIYICLSIFFFFSYVFSQTLLPKSWYVSVMGLGWFYQVVWWMDFDFNSQWSLKIITYFSRTVFMQSRGVASFLCQRMSKVVALWVLMYGELEWSLRGHAQ